MRTEGRGDTGLSMMCDSVLPHEGCLLVNPDLVRVIEHFIRMCVPDSLYLQNKQPEAFATPYGAPGVVDRIQSRGEVLKQRQRIGVVSLSPRIFQIRSPLLPPHLEIHVLQ